MKHFIFVLHPLTLAEVFSYAAWRHRTCVCITYSFIQFMCICWYMQMITSTMHGMRNIKIGILVFIFEVRVYSTGF